MEVCNPVPTNRSLKFFNLRMTTISRWILTHKLFHQELWWSKNEVEMDMLKECALHVVKKATISLGVQQSIRELGPVVRVYTSSSVEKTDILLVGVPIAPHSVRRHQLAPLPGWMIRIYQPDKNALNLQCPIFVPHRVAKISKPEKQVSTAKKKILSFHAPRSQRCRRTWEMIQDAQARESNPALFKIQVRRKFFERWTNELRKRVDSKRVELDWVSMKY